MEYRSVYTPYGWMSYEVTETKKNIDRIVGSIADALETTPCAALIYAARYLITEYDRSYMPDWIEALANGNLNIWNDVVDEVRRLKKAEEAEDDDDDDFST